MRLKRLLPIIFLLTAILLPTGCIRKGTEEIPDSEKELDHLVILEVFYAGNFRKTYEEKKKDGTIEELGYIDNSDQYIKIHNPTKEIKYLDGLAIAQTEFASTEKIEFVKDSDNFMDERTAVHYVMYFPGTGKDYPIQPGETKIITGAAMDHTKDQGWDEDMEEFLRKANPNSYDLSVAHFQWHDEDAIEATGTFGLKLNSAVPSLKTVFRSNSARFRFFQIFHYKGLMLIDFPEAEFDQDKQATHYRKFEYDKVITNTSNRLIAEVMTIPNSSIIDCVVVSPTEEFRFSPVSEAIDKGSKGTSSVHLTGNSADRPDLGKAIRRQHDGKKWVDTNNSSVDFVIVDAGNKTDYSDITKGGTAIK